ncbi:hypothetical protein [Chryseobacterium bernardetii]|uniref:Uncharacterized protein n=1 Tax=Chryseobacterium bernardetii TaxID=1241978 RepID=A0A3G6U2N9_9FLAO|nr:hypothetical protein [Chryseobacterium bernardetii]AZB26188.1 hypothetical protein EG339_17110 [Chryseobacterium bernardetii]AZB32700.1 hypothetical protein EG351_03010 [Chryseobacterium bernardetii]
MKKLASILLLSLYLVSTTEVYQLLKIPTLIEHYWEHKKLNPEMSITAFLKTHYDHPVKDSDYKKDRKLPFIIHTTPLALLFIIGDTFHFELNSYYLKQIKSGKIPSKDVDFCYKGFLRTAWEPPRQLFS